ncbi:MAG TPA: DUF58 domain-containing protein, partial [Gemmataceae bacterium]|nr:DUF58 domain-containing protein [Gemmataceae bacterium]
MLTSRAWWFLSILVGLLIVGMLIPQPVLALVSLVLLLWLAWEGLLFNFRARWVARDLVLRRQVRDDRGPVTSLWAGRLFDVRLALRLRGGSLPHARFEETLPFGLDVASGSPESEGPLSPDAGLTTVYRIRPLHPGRVRFEGVRVQLADLHGLFYRVTFVRSEATFRVLPSLVDAEGKTATSKRHNLLPPPGINRLRRPGTGSELLDLRDYLPGDPPKTIAWKVSARRDRLITKEYESEVPLRCTLFVDTSNSVRLGPPGKNALARLVEVASAVAQANMSARDLTGLCLFDEKGVALVKPARTRRHLVQLFNQLADAAGQPPASGSVNIDALMPLAYSFAQEVYPEQMEQGVNRVPWWLPLFVPVPGPWVTRRTTATRVYRAIALTLATGLLVVFGAVLFGLVERIYTERITDFIPEGVEDVLAAWLERERGQAVRVDLEQDVKDLLPPRDQTDLALIVLLGLLFTIWIGFVRDSVPLLFSSRRRRLTRYRKKLSALFAHRYDLGPGGIELLLRDGDQFGSYLERFLNEHHVPHTPTLYDRDGRFLYASPGKIDILATALLRSVGKGHDNELFVLMADLVELEDRLEPLLRAVKVALARHHQVMVICPWPPDLDPPGSTPDSSALNEDPLLLVQAGGKGKKAGKRKRASASMPPGEMKEFLKRVMARRFHRAYHRLRKTFARLHVPLVCATAGDSVHLILERLDRLR